MAKTTNRTFAIPTRADQQMLEEAKRRGFTISEIYREAVKVFLADQGIEVDVTVEMGSPALLALRGRSNPPPSEAARA